VSGARCRGHFHKSPPPARPEAKKPPKNTPTAPTAIGRLCERCDGKCPVCDSHVRPHTLVRICDECNFGALEGRCVICGAPGVADAYYCRECTIQEKDVSVVLMDPCSVGTRQPSLGREDESFFLRARRARNTPTDRRHTHPPNPPNTTKNTARRMRPDHQPQHGAEGPVLRAQAVREEGIAAARFSSENKKAVNSRKTTTDSVCSCVFFFQNDEKTSSQPLGEDSASACVQARDDRRRSIGGRGERAGRARVVWREHDGGKPQTKSFPRCRPVCRQEESRFGVCGRFR